MADTWMVPAKVLLELADHLAATAVTTGSTPLNEQAQEQRTASFTAAATALREKVARHAVETPVPAGFEVERLDAEADECRAVLTETAKLLGYLLRQYEHVVGIHAQIVMDTEEDRETHRRSIEAMELGAKPVREWIASLEAGREVSTPGVQA